MSNTRTANVTTLKAGDIIVGSLCDIVLTEVRTGWPSTDTVWVKGHHVKDSTVLIARPFFKDVQIEVRA